MVWGCLLLWFYSRVRTRLYKGHFKGTTDKILNRNTFTVSMYFVVIQMTLKRKNNHSTEFSVLKMVKNEILHKILGLFCQKLKIQDGRDDNHLDFDLYMTLNRKNNHANGISVLKFVKNEVLHKILEIFCQKLKFQDGRRKP